MATRKEAMAFIRFQLESLRARNLSHEFEHICRQYARLRIDKSVVPATGPVAGTGDQGRDFESLITFQGDSSPGNRNVFACTLQQEKLSTKIKSDLRKLAKGTPIRTVYYFSGADVRVADRHSIQEWAHDELGLTLEILDGQALSEHLTDPDLLWIAEEYLDISPTHLPTFQHNLTSYEMSLEEWKSTDKEITSVADFVTVKHGIRLTTREPQNHPEDAPTWLSAMRRFVSRVDSSNAIWRAAAYELATGTFFHRQDVSSLQELVVEYVETLPNDHTTCSPAELRDYLTMLNLAQGSTKNGAFGLDARWIDEHRARIESHCARSLESETRPTPRCGLLNVRALLAAFDHRRDKEAREAAAVDAWSELVETAQEARLFNVHALAAALAGLAPTFQEQVRFRDILRKLDAIVADRVGGHAAAELARQRAIKLVEADQTLAALDEAHRAMLHLYDRESIADFTRILIMISALYSGLDLDYASLYYAQAALALLPEDGDPGLAPLVAQLLHEISDYRYFAGHSYAHVIHAELALGTDPSAVSGERLECTLARYVGTVAMIELFEPRLAKVLKARWATHPLGESFHANWDTGQSQLPEMLSEPGNNSSLPKFTDCGRHRTHRWRAVGIEWRVSCANTADDVGTAELISAALQIVQADIARRDPSILGAAVDIDVVTAGDGDHFAAQRTEAGWRVSVGRAWCFSEPNKLTADLLGFVACLGPGDALLKVIKASLEGGLGSKLIVGGPYPALRRTALLGRRVRTVRSRKLFAQETVPALRVHAELEPANGRLKGHHGEAWNLAINGRYQRWMEMMAPALRRLGRDKAVMKTVMEWRTEGIPEWHIIGAVGSLAFNIWVVEKFGADALADPSNARQHLADLPANADIELTEFLLERASLEACMRAYLPSFLATEGFPVDPDTWEQDRDAYEKFAADRLGFLETGPAPPDWLGESG